MKDCEHASCLGPVCTVPAAPPRPLKPHQKELESIIKMYQNTISRVGYTTMKGKTCIVGQFYHNLGHRLAGVLNDLKVGMATINSGNTPLQCWDWEIYHAGHLTKDGDSVAVTVKLKRKRGRVTPLQAISVLRN